MTRFKKRKVTSTKTSLVNPTIVEAIIGAAIGTIAGFMFLKLGKTTMTIIPKIFKSGKGLAIKGFQLFKGKFGKIARKAI